MSIADTINQEHNRAQFQVLIDDQVLGVKEFSARILAEAGAAEVYAYMATEVAELSDETLEAISQKYLFGDENALLARRQAFQAPLSRVRFQKICELVGLGFDTQAALERDDLWDVAAANGLSREAARDASDQVYAAGEFEPALEDFLMGCSREISIRAQREAERWLDIDGVRCAVIAKTPVLWSGWECDGTAWVVEREGQRILVTTNHGSQVIGDVAMLQAKMREYEEALKATQALLTVLEQGQRPEQAFG